MFYASSTLGSIIIVDVRSGIICRTYEGHRATLNDFVECVEQKTLITAGDDFVCNVYDLTEEPKSMTIKRQAEKIKKAQDKKEGAEIASLGDSEMKVE